ncbi:hypothetical protein BaRGS_00029082 [Batillaria attramentaria]|uniref:Uncharacterized protein n=1 Tax=Batillaria attramentaria TaxID=370345 RepID=A0ABD0JXF1_9CAEN
MSNPPPSASKCLISKAQHRQVERAKSYPEVQRWNRRQSEAVTVRGKRHRSKEVKCKAMTLNLNTSPWGKLNGHTSAPTSLARSVRPSPFSVVYVHRKPCRLPPLAVHLEGLTACQPTRETPVQPRNRDVNSFAPA